MKKIKIVDKRKFSFFISILLILLGTFIFLVYKIYQFKKNEIAEYQKSEKQVENQKYESESSGQVDVKQDSLKKEEQDDMNVEAKTYTEYNNQRYAYAITFPDDWYLNSDSSESEAELIEMEGEKVSVGGQTFWSNYKNIEEFSPDQKPDDFHLLGLSVYETGNMTLDQLAQALGFSDEAASKEDEIIGKSISGKEFIAPGDDEKNPQVMIIFQKEQRFYVFNIGFPNGDSKAAETMENIARTLVLK